MTIHVITDTYSQAVDYGRDQGFSLAAIKHITQASQMAGGTLHRATIHVLPEARELRNYDTLIRLAIKNQATLVYGEEA